MVSSSKGLWWGAVGLACACLVVRLLVDDEIAGEVAYLMAPAISVALLVWRSRQSSPREVTAWPILALGAGLLLGAEVTWFVDDLREIEAYPSWGEYQNVAAVLVIGWGLWRTVQRVAPVGDRTGLIDSTAVALAAATLCWLLIVEPAAASEDLGAAEQGWMIGLLALDVGLLAVLTRLGFALRVRPPAYLFIYLAAGGLVGLDGAESMLEVSADVDLGVASDLGMMAAYSCWGLAALRSDEVQRTPASVLRYLGTRRILVLGTSALVPLGAATLQQLRGEPLTATGWLVVGLAGLAIGGLVMIRIAGLVTTVRNVADASGRERFAAMIEHSSDVILTLDRTSTITYCSPAMAQVWGHPPDPLIGQSLAALVPEPHGPETTAQIERSAALPREATLHFETPIARADGAIRSAEGVAANLLDHPAVGAIVVTLRDTTDRRTLEAQLRERAFHDELTGLANRALFLDRVQHALERRGSSGDVVVLFIDLDAFKQVNDGLGHAAGDELLTAVGERLEQRMAPGDTTARLGGDEFAVLLEGQRGLPHALQSAQRVLDAFEVPLHAGGLELSVAASVGVAIAADGDTPEGLIQHADIAMYEAKGSRTTSLAVFDPGMQAAASERISLRSDLERAVEDKQFEVVYQPIVELRSGRVKGAEALLRWTHPERGPVSPDLFIPIAEQTGLIGAIGQWVLERACQDAASWHAPGPAPSVNVNVSAVQLHDTRLVERVARALAGAELDPSRLIVEVTETAMMADPDGTSSVLEELRALGVGIAIDDFGTGYCSLGYLKRFAVDILKIDRTFVSEVKPDSERLLAHSILNLARDLGVETVGEGIEEEAQLRNLRAHGCTYGQGWHLGRPVDSEAFAGLLQRGRPALPV